jgi:hypothetical protein
VRHLIILSLVIGASVSTLGQKTILDGNSLATQCESQEKLNAGQGLSDQEFAKGTFCVGYIRGVLDTMVTWKAIDKAKSKPGTTPHPCIPDTVPNSQAVKITLKFLKDHPERLHLPADVLVFQAMHQAFPCR